MCYRVNHHRPVWPGAERQRAPVQNGARVTQSIPLHAFVEKLARRRVLSDRDREALFALPHVVKTMRRHDYLVREEEEAKNCCVILSGFAVRHKATRYGARQIFSIDRKSTRLNSSH